MLTIDLLRHGQPAGGDKLRGALDDPLSELGWEQLRAATRDGRGWTRVICSPLRRCREFAEEIAAERDLPLSVLPELHEMRYGDWEGLRTEDMWADPELQPQLAAFWDDPIGNPPPGGETLDDFAARNLRGWQALAAHAPGEHLLVVAHGGTNRMLIGNALGLPTHTHWGFEIPYACLSRLRVYREPGQRFNVVLAFHNGRAG